MRGVEIGVVGCGGIGSYFIRNLHESVKKDLSGISRVNSLSLTVFDHDTVEEKNLLYANYDVEDLGKRKVDVMEGRFYFKGVHAEINAGNCQELLEKFDLVVMCVDNNDTRLAVYHSGKSFIDLRAIGSTIFAYLRADGANDNGEYLRLTKAHEGFRGSCQYKEDIENRTIRFGNRVVAEVGLQLLQNHLLNNETLQRISFHL